jgi:predicted dehydrogenase
MNGRASIPTLRIGFIGRGFIANFHLQALLSVRPCHRVGSLQSERHQSRGDGRKGQCARARSLAAVIIAGGHADFGEVDAVWIGVPNFARLDIVREIHRLVQGGMAMTKSEPRANKAISFSFSPATLTN